MMEKREEALKTIEFYKKEMKSRKPNYSTYCALGYAYFDIKEYLKAIEFYNTIAIVTN